MQKRTPNLNKTGQQNILGFIFSLYVTLKLFIINIQLHESLKRTCLSTAKEAIFERKILTIYISGAGSMTKGILRTAREAEIPEDIPRTLHILIP